MAVRWTNGSNVRRDWSHLSTLGLKMIIVSQLEDQKREPEAGVSKILKF